MANSIEYVKKYVDNLDEVFRLASCTAILDSPARIVRQGANANEILIPKTSYTGLGNYDRENGYPMGSVKVEYETRTFDYDRGKSFVVDAMDAEESVFKDFGAQMADFVRRLVAPELDAWRFSRYASLPNANKSSETFTDGKSVLKSLQDAVVTLENNEVDLSDAVLFITPANHMAATSVDSYVAQGIFSTFASTVKVPPQRFNSKIELIELDQKNGKNGGFKVASDSKPINYMIIPKRLVIQYNKHVVSKIFKPMEHPGPDGWMFFYRAYGIATAADNASTGILVNTAPGATGGGTKA